MSGAEVVGGICLIAGLLLLGVGVYLGAKGMATAATGDAKKKLDDAEAKLDATQERIMATRASLGGGGTGEGGFESFGAANPGAAKEAADDAATTAAEAKSAIEQVAGIIGSLPENLRFAGLLVMVGTLLISVATIQFGGTSLF